MQGARLAATVRSVHRAGQRSGPKVHDWQGTGGMTPALLMGDEGAVRVLTLDRPRRLNALDGPLRGALVAALQEAAEDEAVGAVLITGSGERAFCAGQDLNESSTLGGADEGGWIGSWQRMFTAFIGHPKPIVAALNGIAAGGGLEIAMFSDLRVGTPATRLIMAEVDIGLPTLIGSYFLQLHLFESRMREIVLSGRTIEAEEARDIGLLQRVVAPEALQAEALALAGDLAAKPPRAMALTLGRFRQRLLGAIERGGLWEALGRYQGEAMASGEPQEVMAGFLAERARRKEIRTHEN